MAQITLNLKTPIKIIETDHYYLVIEDADGVQHFFHNGHTTRIKGKIRRFYQGDYDGYSKDCRTIESIN